MGRLSNLSVMRRREITDMRKNNLDYLKVLAIICVIAIHVYDKLITSYALITPQQWFIVNRIESFLRFSIPVFFMINGTLLLRKYEGEKGIVFYKRAFPRLLVAYVIATFISLEASSQWFGTTYTFNDFWTSLTNFTGFYHLWFFQTLMTIYLFVPALRLMIRFIHRADTHYLLDAFILFWIGSSIVTPFITTTFQLPEVIFSSPFVTWILPYIGYFVFGYYLEYRIKPLISNRKLAVFALGVTFLAGTTLTSAIMVYGLDIATSAIPSQAYYPYSLNIFLSSTGVTGIFLLLENKFKANRIVQFLSQNSLIIFLIHPIIIGYLEFNYQMDILATESPLLEAFKLFALTLAVSVLIAGAWQLMKTLTTKFLAVLSKNSNTLELPSSR